MHFTSPIRLQPPAGRLNVCSRIAPPSRGQASLNSETHMQLAPKGKGGNKALFLDRDGVINTELRYVYSREDFHFQDGIFELCQAARALGYLLVVVTNQAGIARGYFRESEFIKLTEWMIREFDQRRIPIARVYYCPYHPVYGVGQYKFDSADRKPRPGMLLRARMELDLDLASSMLIGDKLSDIGAAEAAGVGTRILVHSLVTEPKIKEGYCYVADSLSEIQSNFFFDPF